jgi:protease-4
MRITSGLCVLLLLATSTAGGQTSFPSYYRQNDFLLTSPGAFKFGLYGYDNPALPSLLREPDVSFLWSDQTGKWDSFNRWGVFAAAPGVGFGLIHETNGSEYVTDYKVSLSTGDRTLSTGIAYGWSSGYTRFYNRSNLVTVGSLFRPNYFLSVGFLGTLALQSRGANEAAADVAVRPFGNEWIMIFGDYAIQDKQSPQNGHWSTGGALEILPGVCFTGRFFDTKAFTVGVQLSLGRGGVTTQAHFDVNQRHSFNTYGLRLGAFDRTTFTSRGHDYLNLNLLGPIKYQRFRFLDNAHTLSDLLDAIEAAKEDPAVAGIAINTSGMVADKELLWEVREKLKEFRTTGKHVVIFIDQADMNKYHFASVADRIVMDPQGLIQLNGFLMGRTFLKGTLEKVGVGFDEWRFFKYKSANESLSRDKMSDADREQRQKLVDDSYKLAKTDICASRGLSAERFDAMVNDEVVYIAADAVEKGLVDTVGRWETVEQVIKNLEGTAKRYVAAGALERFVCPTDSRWSEPPTIAVIYALGACAMDEGITARQLVNDVEAAVNNSKVKAIVLRVDSPGGDPMASDYIAEALKKAKGKKPVIVSQGAVAASGGYWLSMYADTIVAAPTTITGSIGVIGGWVYSKGIKETLGMSTDFVKAGEHADLGFGFTLPFIGLGLPDRNLTEAERSRMEYTIRSMYKDFVQRVAAGRKKTEEYIGSIAQGRVWSGYDGLSNGLVDVLGGLETAINIAKERAGIPKGSDIDILSLPKPGLINFGQFIPKIVGVESGKKDPLFEHLKFRLQHNGQPMPVLPVEDIDFLREY